MESLGLPDTPAAITANSASERTFTFLHHAVAMHLDGPLRDTELVRNLLMHPAANQQVEDRALTGRRAGSRATATPRDTAVLFADLAMPSDCAFHSFRQLFLAHRLGQKVFRARL